MVDYRLTPEHPYPAALDDCVHAFRWLTDIQYGYKPHQIVVVGDSCGGGLSATVPLKIARNGWKGAGAAVSLSPWYDCVSQESASLKTNMGKDALGSTDNLHVLEKMCTDEGKAAKADDPLISALYASDEELKKLPPTYISCGGCDMLLDDGTRFAEKLKKVGVDHVLKVAEGEQHVFEFKAGRDDVANASIKAIGEWVRKKIGS
jgi:epsilon-lactone hydrolase